MPDEDAVRRLVDWLIEQGVASVHEHETRPERIKGCLAGFELVRTLPPTLEAYQQCLAERRRREVEMVGRHEDAVAYWEYRCATAQVEHVYERLKIIFGAPVVSGFAAMHVGEWVAKERQ